jgi:large subunit ribosomal protein L7/L12
LKEAKEMVEGAPSDIKEDVPTAEANELKEKLEGVGATVELK